ncbi:hypothetical protein SGFS_104060 [Streptomyces graminofaciens]|uniref:Uncharacterized protein n=1 Tax=Streptomyces graminofaciens TaxID=68212 RepID=A0ABN5W0X8_9ACTN|nr:hypothetical protein [Streptomyces graminofaciens]BBC39112.1 hypothetical protein SGFS_104060 [Streptomyces graminofaciens]
MTISRKSCTRAAVPGPVRLARQAVKTGSAAFRDRLVATAAEAGAPDPQSLGRQLAVIYEGANSLSASCNDAEAFEDARRAAEALLKTALEQTA